MKERPILFSSPMVRAILAGTKTQTRRIVNESQLRVILQREVRSDLPFDGTAAKPGLHRASMNPNGAVSVHLANGHLGMRPGEFHFSCPYADGLTHLGQYGVGERNKRWTIAPRGSRLWVRETWASADRFYQTHECDPPRTVAYAADRSAYYSGGTRANDSDTDSWNWDALKWRPSIFMPRSLSRITLEVTSVRVERLQDISEEDAKAEGVIPRTNGFDESGPTKSHRTGFVYVWQDINAKRAPWESNPWVWVVEFNRVQP